MAQSLKQNTGEFLAQAKVSAMQNGVLLNEKELLKGISSSFSCYYNFIFWKKS